MKLPTAGPLGRVCTPFQAHKNTILAVARGTAWTAFGTLACYGLNFLTTLLSARMLGKTGYGEYCAIQSTVALVGGIASVGMTATASRHVAAFVERKQSDVGAVIGTCAVIAGLSGLIGTALLVLTSSYTASRFLGQPQLSSSIQISAITMLFWVQVGVQNGVWAGLARFDSLTTASILRAALGVPATAIGTSVGGIDGLLIANSICMLLTVTYAHRRMVADCAQIGVIVDYRAVARHLSLFGGFSLPTLLGSLVQAPAIWAAQVLLLRQPDGVNELARLNLSQLWRNVLFIVPQALSTVNLPMLSSRLAVGRSVDARTLLRGTVVGSSALAFPLAILLSLGSDVVMAAYGPSYLDVARLIRITVWSTALIVVMAPLGDFLLALGRPWACLAINVVTMIAMLALASLLLSTGFRAEAICYAQLGAAAVQFLLLSAAVLCLSMPVSSTK